MVLNKNDIHDRFLKLTQTEIDQFCAGDVIDPILETQVPGDKTANECPTDFLLELVGVARIMHFETLWWGHTYEPSLLMFRRFFRLALNGDWYTIEKTQCEAPLLSHTVEFFEVLNEKDPGVNDLDQKLLLRLRAYRSKLRAYPEELLVMLGISQDWAEAGFEPVLYLNDKGALDYILLNDPSKVEINQKVVPEGNPSVVRRNEHATTAVDFEMFIFSPLLIVHLPRSKLPPLAGLPDLLVPLLLLPNLVTLSLLIVPIKMETPEVSSEVGVAPDQQVAAILKKLNKTKRVVPKKYVPAVDDSKKLKTILEKKPKGGASKIASPGKGVSVVDTEEVASSKVFNEKKKEKVEEKVNVVSKEKPEVVKGKGPIKANFPVLVPRWNVRVCETTASSETCQDMLRNMYTLAEKSFYPS
ncbi:hypothetical protein Hanom_Chr02g00146381 [Helianthus anomalus]